MGFHQFSLALVVMMMMILLKPNCGRAAVVVKSNTTYQCNGPLNDCRIGEDMESEMHFFMDSNVIRILQDAGNTITPKTLDANLAVKNQLRCEGASVTNCIAKGDKAQCKNIVGCRGQL